MLETLELHHNLKLGFTYPCDGPGRGGFGMSNTALGSLVLNCFWMSNCLNVST